MSSLFLLFSCLDTKARTININNHRNGLKKIKMILLMMNIRYKKKAGLWPACMNLIFDDLSNSLIFSVVARYGHHIRTCCQIA